MSILLSVFIRIFYVGSVVFYGMLIGIAVGMGFDSGLNTGAILVLIIYLFTFLPAIIIGFLPLKVLRNPSLLLKFWYGWIIVIFSWFFFYKYFLLVGSGFTGLFSEKGKICYVIDLNTTSIDKAPYIFKSFKRNKKYYGSHIKPDRLRTGRWCEKVAINHEIFSLQAVTVSAEYGNSIYSAKRGMRIPSHRITLNPRDTVCVYINQIPPNETNQSGWELKSGACKQDLSKGSHSENN